MAIVCEADADFRAASTLIDRVLVEQIEWLEAENIEHVRCYAGVESEYEWTRLQNVDALLKARKLKVKMGHFLGEPGDPDALMARKSILLLSSMKPRPDVLVVIRDTDNQPERKDGLDQARSEYHGRPPLALGVAIIKRENWILAGFRSRDDDENQRLQAERQRLGYDPSQSPHRANSHEYRSKNCPKQVLENLMATADRELECLRETALEELQTRGINVGLADFLKEIEATICPLLRTDQRS